MGDWPSSLSSRQDDKRSVKKDAIVNAARMLAIQVGHYQRKFGTLPLEEAIELLETETLNEDQAGWVADGLENLAVAIASVKDEEKPPTVQ